MGFPASWFILFDCVDDVDSNDGDGVVVVVPLGRRSRTSRHLVACVRVMNFITLFTHSRNICANPFTFEKIAPFPAKYTPSFA